jgi:hypothetical protein
MYVAVRRYSQAPELLKALEEGQAEVMELLRQVSGLRSYYLVRAGDGGFSVTICDDRAGVEESNLLAADWITEHALALPGNAPALVEGEMIMQFVR